MSYRDRDYTDGAISGRHQERERSIAWCHHRARVFDQGGHPTIASTYRAVADELRHMQHWQWAPPAVPGGSNPARKANA